MFLIIRPYLLMKKRKIRVIDIQKEIAKEAKKIEKEIMEDPTLRNEKVTPEMDKRLYESIVNYNSEELKKLNPEATDYAAQKKKFESEIKKYNDKIKNLSCI